MTPGSPVIIVDYNAGNITSVERALASLNVKYHVSSNPQHILKASKVIFPGVGAADYAMNVLRKRGLDEALKEFAARGRPLLGICLGAQILLEYSQESANQTSAEQHAGHTPLLGIIPGCVLKFPENLFESPQELWGNTVSRRLKVPHIGWNTVRFTTGENVLFQGIPQESSFYFNHSYYLQPRGSHTAHTPHNALGLSLYGIGFASIIGKDNIVGMQFHPEKSGPAGLKLLNNFLKLE